MTDSIDAVERALLGGLMRWPTMTPDVLLLLRDTDLRTDAHQRIFRAIARLADTGKPIDTYLVGQELVQHGEANDVPLSYLGELYLQEPTGAYSIPYAQRIRNASILRQLETAAGETLREAQEAVGTADEILEGAEKRIFAIAQMGIQGQTHALAAIVTETAAAIEARTHKSSDISGLTTGYLDLDALMAGLHPGELVMVGARPGVGKTTFGLAVARNVLHLEQKPVFFASLEQSRQELAERLLCMETRLNSGQVRKGLLAPADLECIAEARDTLAALPLHIDDTASQSMLRIAASARRVQMKWGLGLVVVDYLQLVSPENRKDPRQEQVAGISRRLKGLARELNVPVIALAQLNRGVEERSGQKPRLADFRESGGLEADADAALLLHRDKDRPAELEIIIGKQRNGPTGQVILAYEPACYRFSDYAIGVPFEDAAETPVDMAYAWR